MPAADCVCVICKKQCPEDDNECYMVFRCRRDHVFRCCKVECLRAFEKRCQKVMDSIDKMQHNLNNDGHTSALRRLPPGEREKVKQFKEASDKGEFVCPYDVKACDRSVPVCAQLMSLFGMGKAEAAAMELPAPPPHTRSSGQAVAPKVAASTELLDFGSMEVIKKEEPSDAAQKKEKNVPKKKESGQKKGVQKMDLRTLITTAEVVEEVLPAPKPVAAVQPSRSTSGPSPSHQAWGTVPTRQADLGAAFPRPSPGLPTPVGRPPNAREKIDELVSIVGCSVQQAELLLEQNDWHTNLAANAYFGREEELPKWGPSRHGHHREPAAALQQEAAEPSRARSNSKESEAEVAQAQPPSEPNRTPKPVVPEGWQAVWHEESHQYYFWHHATNHTTWEIPPGPEGAQADSSAVLDEAALVAEVRANYVDLDEVQARHLLMANDWSLEMALASHQRACQVEKERLRREEAERARLAAEAEARRQAEERRLRPGLYTCHGHWKPTHMAEMQSCLSALLQGDQVCVEWSEGEVDGWAFGYSLENKGIQGYFPRQLVSTCKRQPQKRREGQRSVAAAPFKSPPGWGGFLSLEPGDELLVLHDTPDPHAWVFVARLDTAEVAEGWVPESALEDSDLIRNGFSG